MMPPKCAQKKSPRALFSPVAAFSIPFLLDRHALAGVWLHMIRSIRLWQRPRQVVRRIIHSPARRKRHASPPPLVRESYRFDSILGQLESICKSITGRSFLANLIIQSERKRACSSGSRFNLRALDEPEENPRHDVQSQLGCFLLRLG